MKTLATMNGSGKSIWRGLLILAIAIGCGFAAGGVRTEAGEPAITGITLDGAEVVIAVQVPPGLRKITLQSSRRAGTGAWEPRAVWRLDGQGGEVTFRLPRSANLEFVRVRADETEPLPASFYQGTNVFPGTALSGMSGPGFVAFDAIDNRAGVEASPSAAPARDVVESDIWKVEGDVLYFFNQYRGLQVIDVADPDSPVILGTLSMPAAGEQMYVLAGKEVVLLARDGCGWDPAGSSQVLIVATAGGPPTLVTSLPVSGQIQESRLVGTALYVTTQTYRPIADATDGAWEWGTSVYAFDLANPATPVVRPSLWYGGYGNVLSATDRFLFASVQNGSGGSQVHCVDITAPDGTLQKAGSLRVAGQVKDKFKIHLHGEILTVISEAWLSQSPDASGRWQPVTKLETFSLADPNSPQKLGELELAAGEQLHATRFDGDRVYVVTFFRIDPLWVVDLSDPTRPSIRGELEVPGWSTYIQPMGDRLLTIGIDDANGWRVAVSLFDVHDPTKPALLSKVPLGENSSWSEANSDEKAFGFLPEAGLILVPYSTYSTNNQQGVQLIDLAGDTLVKRGFIAHEVQARRSTIHRDRILSISGRELLSVDASDRDKPVVRSETELAWPVNRVFIQDNFLIELETGSGGWNESVKPTIRVVPLSAPDRIANWLALENLPLAGATLQDGHLYILQGSTTYYAADGLPEDSKAAGSATNRTTLVCSVLDVSKLPDLEVVSSARFSTGTEFSGTAEPAWPKPDLLVWVTQQGNYWGRWYPMVDFGGISIMPMRGFADFWMPFYGSGERSLFAVSAGDPRSVKFESEVTLRNTNGWATFSKPFVADQAVFLSEQFTETSITATNYLVVTNTTTIFQTNVVRVTNTDDAAGSIEPADGVLRTNIVKVPQLTTTTYEQPVYAYRQVSLLHVVDYADSSAPLPRRPIGIPGTLEGLSPDGALLYLRGAQVEADAVADGTEWLHACAYDGVATYLVDSHPLPKEWPRPALARHPHIFVARPRVEKTTESAIEVWTLSEAGKFTRLNERGLAGSAYALHEVGPFLAVQEDAGVELFDLTRPVELPWVGGGRPGSMGSLLDPSSSGVISIRPAYSSCMGWNLEHAAGTFQAGFWIPLDAYGVDRIEVKR